MKPPYITILFLAVFLNACNTKTESNLNLRASINEGSELSENPLLENVITTSINPKEGTMQTLYGNGVAWSYVNTHSDLNYPKGSKLFSVTWKQKPDSLWFGANIPEEIISVEQISFNNYNQPQYAKFQGNPLKKQPAGTDTVRLSQILAQKMAVSP